MCLLLSTTAYQAVVGDDDDNNEDGDEKKVIVQDGRRLRLIGFWCTIRSIAREQECRGKRG